MREATFTAAVGKKLPPCVDALKINLRFQKGVADSWYDGPGGDLWVEWKYLPALPRIVDPMKLLSAHQKRWLERRHTNGRNVAVIVGCGNCGVVFHKGAWDTPISRDEFFDKSLSKQGLADWIMSQCT